MKIVDNYSIQKAMKDCVERGQRFVMAKESARNGEIFYLSFWHSQRDWFVVTELKDGRFIASSGCSDAEVDAILAMNEFFSNPSIETSEVI
jgi:hypothetical protein